MLKEQLNQDLKAAMLSGDKPRAEVLRGLKSAILYEEVAQKARDIGLSEEATLVVLTREAKKRADSAQLYAKAGESTRAETELSEKAIIDAYLPAQMTDETLAGVVEEIVAANPGMQMGPLIGEVRKQVGAQADGSRIAAAVKAKIQG